MTGKKTKIEVVLGFLASLIRSKYFWRGFCLIVWIGILVYLLYSDLTCDGKNKKFVSKSGIKKIEEKK